MAVQCRGSGHRRAHEVGAAAGALAAFEVAVAGGGAALAGLEPDALVSMVYQHEFVTLPSTATIFPGAPWEGMPKSFYIQPIDAAVKDLSVLMILYTYGGLYLDTTMAFTPFVEETMPFPPDQLPRLAGLGDRILFGSDFPNIPYRYAESLEVLSKVAPDDDWMRKVLYHNAAKLFDLGDQVTEPHNAG